MNITLFMTVLLVETFTICFSFLGSWFIGCANREDKELKIMRIVFSVILFTSLNIIIFLN